MEIKLKLFPKAIGKNLIKIMTKSFKKQFGYLARGVIGFFQDNFDKLPNIPENFPYFEIGKSVQNQPIKCFKIGNGQKKILYVFGIHGNEVGTVKLAYHFLIWANKNITKFKKHTLFIIPSLNPDGYKKAIQNPEYFKGGKTGRFNANNVDLNRNFSTPSFQKKSLWSFGKNYSENTEIYCGEFGNSEPEIKSLTKFIKNQKIKILFMFHNAGQDVMGNKNETSQKLTKIYSKKTGFRYISDNKWKLLKQTGTAKEWCEVNKIAYVEVEGSARWGSDWKKQKPALIATINI
jgi:hypothetical protein